MSKYVDHVMCHLFLWGRREASSSNKWTLETYTKWWWRETELEGGVHYPSFC